MEWANRSCAAPRNLRPAAAPSYTGEQLCRRKRWCRILLRSIHIYIYYIVLCSTSIPHCRSPMSVPPMPVHGRDARVAGCRLASHSRTQLQWGGALLVLIVAVLHDVHSAVTRTAVPPYPFRQLPVHGRGAQVAGWMCTPALNCSGLLVLLLCRPSPFSATACDPPNYCSIATFPYHISLPTSCTRPHSYRYNSSFPPRPSPAPPALAPAPAPPAPSDFISR